MRQFAQGGTSIQDAIYRLENGDRVDPVDPLVSILDVNGTTVSGPVAPNRLSTGHYDYTYVVPVDATIGEWTIHWEGVINGLYVEVDEHFLVAAPGTVSAPTDDVTGPCQPWTTLPEVLACAPASFAELDEDQQASAIDLASELLWNLTGRVYGGICQVTRNLCRSCLDCFPQICRCEPHNGFDLGIRMPVLDAWDVVVNGVTLDPSEYKVINRRWLARTDGQMWPTGWNMIDDDRFRATWSYGRAVPLGGRRAASILAADIIRQCPALCGTPTNDVSSVSAEGVTYQMGGEGTTGLLFVDKWIEIDAFGRRRRATIFAPGAGSARSYR